MFKIFSIFLLKFLGFQFPKIVVNNRAIRLHLDKSGQKKGVLTLKNVDHLQQSNSAAEISKLGTRSQVFFVIYIWSYISTITHVRHPSIYHTSTFHHINSCMCLNSTLPQLEYPMMNATVSFQYKLLVKRLVF